MRVFLGEHGERADHLAYLGHPYAAGVVYNQVTAAACVRVVEALLPGAGTTRISAPAPFGLPGGYPVVIEDGTISLDLPPGQELDEVSAWQSSIARHDGVDSIAADGTVTFTERARDAVAALPRGSRSRCTRTKHPSAPSASARCSPSDLQWLGVDAVFHRRGIGRRRRFRFGQPGTDLVNDVAPNRIGFRTEAVLPQP